MKPFILIILFGWLPLSLVAQYKAKQNLNTDWEFQFQGQSNWEQIHLPHTWNATDAVDDEPGYKRDVGIYQKTISIDKQENENYFLFFEGANQHLQLSINGKQAGEHKGGYTSFGYRITDFLVNGNNQIKIELSNKHNPSIIPLEADFTFFGGIYRDVWLLTTGKAFFDYNYGTNGGIQLTPKIIDENKGEITVEASIFNSYKTMSNVVLRTTLFSPDGKQLKEKLFPITNIDERQILAPKSKLLFYEELKLWSPKSPNLYTVVTTLETEAGLLLDQVTQKVGFRNFSFEQDGFVLNGQKLKLIGSNRHQDELGKGNALSNKDHERDMLMLKNMGINFLRISHYPQDPRILELTDSLGIIAIEEIPFVNEATVSEEFAKNTKQQLREMISRDRNHSSLMAWGTSNELTLKLNELTKSFSEPKKQAYIDFEVELLNDLDQLIQESDETRPSFTVLCCGKEQNIELGYHAADIIGYNKYFGWYEGQAQDLSSFLSEYATIENRPFFLSEYGAGADPRIRTEQPKRFDFSVEWQNQVHQQHLQQILTSKHLFGSSLWNFADFQAEHRNDAVPKLNSKGIVTANRQPKDAYYFYEVALSEEAKIKIPAKLYRERKGIANDDGKLHQTIEVYSNQKTAELFLNEISLGSKTIENFKAEWLVPLQNGENKLVAKSPILVGTIEDELLLTAEVLPNDFSKLDLENKTLAINVGSHFLFNEEVNSNKIWLPDQEYDGESYGYTGGSNYWRDGNELLGSDANILTTSLDPVYQTHRYNIDSYKVKLPKGNYLVELHFAEVLGNCRTENFLRNIESLISAENFKRNMNCSINGIPVNTSVFEAQSESYFQPIVIEQPVRINNEVLTIQFKQNDGFNYLSGLKIRKV